MFREDSQGELSPQAELDAAQAMNEWFPEYLFYVQERPGKLPATTMNRLQRQFGRGNPQEQIGNIRDVLMLLDDEHQANIASYFCGYPMEVLELQALVPVEESIELFDALLPPPSSEEWAAAEVTRRQERRGRKREYTIPPEQTAALLADTALITWFRGPVNSTTDLSWQDDALCAQTDPEAFFPEKGGSTRDAKRICAMCEVRQRCLTYALKNDERFGIWGGKSERERRKMRQAMVEQGLVNKIVQTIDSYETDEQAEIA